MEARRRVSPAGAQAFRQPALRRYNPNLHGSAKILPLPPPADPAAPHRCAAAGTVLWSDAAFAGDARWEYRMVFSDNFAVIAEGQRPARRPRLTARCRPPRASRPRSRVPCTPRRLAAGAHGSSLAWTGGPLQPMHLSLTVAAERMPSRAAHAVPPRLAAFRESQRPAGGQARSAASTPPAARPGPTSTPRGCTTGGRRRRCAASWGAATSRTAP